MKYKTWRKKQLKKKKFRKAYIELLREENLQYSLLIYQQYGRIFLNPEDIKEFRGRLLQGKVKGRPPTF